MTQDDLERCLKQACSPLATRVAKALACPDPRALARMLADQFWREDNPSSMMDTPSLLYERVERAVIEVMANAEL